PVALFPIEEAVMRHSIVFASLLLLTWTSGRLTAQVRLPVVDDDRAALKNVHFEEAAAPFDLRHGRLVRVNMNSEGKTVEGILVRVDNKNGRVYVRTEPGSPPRAFDVKHIQKIEKG